jgi:glycosyltransferase involved in cell wall biosynthesis
MQKYLLDNPSYLDDIHLLGYASNQQRDWLYEHSLAFVFPSVYEGFGLPVLEAMQYGTPVITYKNSSIQEVAQSSAIYTYGTLGIADKAKELLNNAELRNTLSMKGLKQAAKFTWAKTKDSILTALS